MAEYPPPTEDLPIFDNSVFVSLDTPVTIGYANNHYLRFPTAQGTENLAAINVNGTAIFNNQVQVIDNTGSQQDTEMVVFGNVATTGKLGIVMNPQPANYNPIVRGDDTIMSFGQNNGSIANFCIAPWSTTACGLRATKTNLLLGAGGTTTPGNPINPTQNMFFDGSNNRIIITSNDLRVDGNLTMINTSAIQRQITASYLNITDITANLAGLQLYQNVQTTIFDNNATTGGDFVFACNDGSGVQQTPLQIGFSSVQSNKNLLINGLGNYLQFPDGTQQTTAFTSSSQKTYTTQYTSSTSIVLPVNCIGFQCRLIGTGGSAGPSASSNPQPGGVYSSGGSGGGGATIWCNGIIPLLEGTTLNLTVGPGIITGINSPSVGVIATASSGGDGGGASPGVAGVAGAGATIASNFGNTSVASWNSQGGVAGSPGIANAPFQSPAGIPTTAGYPIFQSFSDTTRGSGQRYSGIGAGINFPTTATPYIGGIIYITFYLK